MNRDIILRTACSQKSDTQSVKLIDSRGKKTINSKISIYSQKYTAVSNQVQRQQLKILRTSQKKPQEHFTINSANPNRQAIAIQARREDSAIQQKLPQQVYLPTTANFEYTQCKQVKTYVDASLATSFREHLEAVRIYYEAKIKQIVEDNARVISELRNLLVQQQHRLTEKQQQINKLLNANQNKAASGRAPIIRINTNESPYKSRAINANASYEYLCNKIKDLDINIKLIMEQFVDSENEVKSKIQKVQKQLIRHLAERLGKCWFRIGKFMQNIQNKCIRFQKYFAQLEKQSAKSASNEVQSRYNKITSQLQEKINQFSQDIRNFSTKQYKYENERVQSLQNVLIDLLQKFGVLERKNSLHGSRRMDNGYYLQDEDEFFYPSTDRKVYETNDDYEHFQSQSEDENPHLIKQNISSNLQTYQLQKIKKF